MRQYGKSEALCFDDILLVPHQSLVEHRKEIDLTMTIGYEDKAISLYLPIVGAPMSSITGDRMAKELAAHGGLGSIAREKVLRNQTEFVYDTAKSNWPVAAAVSSITNENFLRDAESLVLAGAKVLIVDTANGHNELAAQSIIALKRAFPTTHIMAGNVATWDGFLRLSLAGADSVRVGIGGGAACTTRLVTGYGVPTLASVMEVYENQERWELPTSIIADGGIRNSGDMVKAFAAGADAVMVGNLLAGHHECLAGRRTQFYGMASEIGQKYWRGEVGTVEGTSGDIKERGPLSSTLDKLRQGIQSGCSYAGANSLEDLAISAEFVKVTANSLAESKPHIV